MDRESADDHTPDLTEEGLPQPNWPEGPVIVSVCTTCKTADDGTARELFRHRTSSPVRSPD